MGKKIIKEPPKRRISTRVIKKKQLASDNQEFFEEEQEEVQNQPEKGSNDSPFSDQDDDEEGSQQSEQSESTPEVNPENFAVRNMQFRERRGTKMTYLINRKKEEEEDPFWAQQGQNYFGNLDDGDNDEEDYEQSSSGRDQFDSDFNQTQSEHEQGEGQSEKEVDQDEEKNKKKKQELMRKIHAPAPSVKKSTQKTSGSVKRQESDRKIAIPETTSRYIHELFNQEELLGQAATTEYFNWLSLKKLISIETQKKDFAKRSHHLEGPKVIYRNKINQEGKNQGTYELSQLQIRKVEDLTQVMRKN